MFSPKSWVRRWQASRRPQRVPAESAVLSLTQLEERAVPTHFRYGTLTWEPTTVANQIEFHVQQAWRRSFFGAPNVGSIVNTANFTFGDGGSAPVQIRVTAVNLAEDWFFGEAVRPIGGGLFDEGIIRTYASPGTRTASMVNCCRISTLRNNNDGQFQTQTIVNVGTGNANPVSSLAPIVNVPDNQVYSFQIPAADPNGDPVRFRLATALEATATNFYTHPPGLTVSSTGVVTFDVRNAVLNTLPGHLWTTQVMIEDLDAAGNVKSKSPLDFILRIGQPVTVNQPPTISASPTGPFQPLAGVNLTFNVTGADADGTIVALQALNPPAGMTFSPFGPPAATKTITANWTPTVAQANQTFVVTFQATDNLGATATTSVTISPVAPNQPPVANAGGPYSVNEGSSIALNGTGSTDADGTIVSYLWDFDYDGITFNVDATGATPNFNAALLDGPLTRNVALRVFDDDGAMAQATTPVHVRNVAPTVDGGTDLTVFEGTTVHYHGTFTDPAPADTHTLGWHVLFQGSIIADEHHAHFDFTPMENGTYTIFFNVTDDDSDEGMEILTLTVLNADPTANDDVATTNEDTPVAVAVLANDTDPAGPNDPLTVVVFSQGANGSVALNPDGTLRYTPSANYYGPDAFTYTISDGDGGFDTATVSVTVLSVNDAPTDIALDPASVAENQPAGTPVGTLTATDVDLPFDSHAYALVSGPAGEAYDNGCFRIVGNQLVTNAVLNYETKSGLLVRVRVTDAGGLSYEEVLPVSVLDLHETNPCAMGTVGGVGWNYDPVLDSLTVTGRSVADAIRVETADVAGVGPVIVLHANGSSIVFDGQGGRPVIYAHGCNHLQLIKVDALGGNDTVVLGKADGTPLPTSAYVRSELDAGSGNNGVTGGAGPDRIHALGGVDNLDGRGGSDTYLATGSEARFDVIADTGTDGTDTLQNDWNDPLVLAGFGPGNGIEVVDGNCLTVLGDGGANVLDFSAARLVNVVYVDGRSGNDTIVASNVPVANDPTDPPFKGYFGHDGNDTITGGSAADLLFGEGGNDRIRGGGGDDSMDGGAGVDDLDGQAGSDTYAATQSEALTDAMADSGPAGDTDTLKNVGLPYLQPAYTHLYVRGFGPANGIEVVDMGGFAIRGDATANTFDFRAARLVDVQYVDGAGGNDTIYASNVPASNVSFEGYFGDDGNDTLYGGDAADKLFGEAGDDRIDGGGGNDTLVGGDGTDVLTGGLGDDVFYVGQMVAPPVDDDANGNGIDDDEEGLIVAFVG